MTRIRTAAVALAAVCLAVAVHGCGQKEAPPKLAPVNGKVQHNGKPLTAGSISFHPDSKNSFTKDNPSGLLQLDGAFTMKTYPFGEGVVPGKYKVTLTPELAQRVKKPDYGRVEKTPWEIEVPDAGLKDQLFEVK